MTRKELDNYFSNPLYESVRHYAKRVMDAHPEITDPLVVAFAVGKMEECEDDGVEISVDDALRLTKEHDPIPTAKDFYETLTSGGIETQEDLMSLLQKGFDGMPAVKDSIPRSAAERAAQMTRLGRELSDGNKDIVLMGVPADLSWDFAQLKIAFFTDKLTDEEQEIIQKLKGTADRVKFYEKYGIGYALFKIDIK